MDEKACATKCPVCGNEMRSGEIQIVSNAWVAPFLGNKWGWFQELLFYVPGAKRGERIRKTLLNHPAFHCPACDAILLPGRHDAPNWR